MRIFSGEFKGRILKTPKGRATRPTKGILREAVFNICQEQIEGAAFLDLFAGSGSMGFEAISRGARFTVFVEQDAQAIRCIRENFQLLQVEERSQLLSMNVFAALSQLQKKKLLFDLIYIDPPYKQETALISDLLIKLTPLLNEESLVFIETSAHEKEMSQIGKLQLKDMRIFGISRLSQFTVHPSQ